MKLNINKSSTWDLLTLLLVTAYPILYLYLRNLPIVATGDLLTSLGLFFLIALLLWLVSSLLLKDLSKGALLASAAMLGMMLFRVAEAILVKRLPSLYYWHVVYLFVSGLALLAFLLSKIKDPETTPKISKIVAALFGILIMTNLVFALPEIVAQVKMERVEESETTVQSTGSQNDENFYYFIFDEYSGLDGLQRYANYNNQGFYDDLLQLGFNISPHSRNYTTSTNIEIPNLLNLAPIVSNQNVSIARRDALFENPLLFRTFKQHGYFINLIDDQAFLSPDNEAIDQSFVPQSNLAKVESFLLVLLRKSILHPYFDVQDQDRGGEILALFSQMDAAKDIAEKQVLTVAYLMVPHKPWVFDENGFSINVSERENWRNPEIYIGQLKYTSSLILKTVERIIKSDPNAIIVIQSDHGYRLPMHLESFVNEEIADRALEEEFQTNILNAVYYKGESFEIEGLSGLDTLIKVVNAHFGLDIPLAGRE